MIQLLTQSEYDFIKESNEIESEIGVDFDHLRAFMMVKEAVAERKTILPCTIEVWHRILMQNKLAKQHAGNYRVSAVGISNGREIIKLFPNPAIVPALMDQWIKEFNSMDFSPWEMHKRFENIHAFIDGNGRSGRLLWAFDLLRRGDVVVPMLDRFIDTNSVLKGYNHSFNNEFQHKRQRYYEALNERQNDK